MIKSLFEYVVSLMIKVIAQFKSLTVKRYAIKVSLNIKNNIMMLSTTLITLTKIIYSRLFEFIMRDKDCFVLKI